MFSMTPPRLCFYIENFLNTKSMKVYNNAAPREQSISVGLPIPMATDFFSTPGPIEFSVFIIFVKGCQRNIF